MRRKQRSDPKHRPAAYTAFTLIETLVAMAILVTCVAAMVSLWAFSFHMTDKSDLTGAAYTAGRRALEEIKRGGYVINPTTLTRTFDRAGRDANDTGYTAPALRATTTLEAGALPNTNSVKVRVVSVSTGETLFQTATLLTQGGI